MDRSGTRDLNETLLLGMDENVLKAGFSGSGVQQKEII